jgi:hypothetical protein
MLRALVCCALTILATGCWLAPDKRDPPPAGPPNDDAMYRGTYCVSQDEENDTSRPPGDETGGQECHVFGVGLARMVKDPPDRPLPDKPSLDASAPPPPQPRP